MINSSHPIQIHGGSINELSSDSFLAIPDQSLGSNYLVMRLIIYLRNIINECI